MSDSDVEIIEDTTIEHTTIEHIVLDSSSEDDIPKKPPVVKAVLDQARRQDDRLRRSGLHTLFASIQALVGGPKEPWKRVRTLKISTSLCQELTNQENNLRLEYAHLLQCKFELCNRVEKLSRKRNKKAIQEPTTDRLSDPLLETDDIKKPPALDEKRRVSMDESKLCIQPIQPAPISQEPSPSPSKGTAKHPVSPETKKTRKKSKKPSGLSADEKEFYILEEKIEDLLYDVEDLWVEVNVSESDEVESDELDSDPVNIKREKDKEFKDNSHVNTEPEASPIITRSKRKLVESLKTSSTNTDAKKTISIANINKLMNPDFVKPSNATEDDEIMEAVSALDKYTVDYTSDRSGDEGSTLVIDDTSRRRLMLTTGESPKTAEKASDMIEALKAVDSLCLSIVTDEPTTSKTKTKRLRKSVNKGVIAISDESDE